MGGGLLIATHLDQSNYLSNQKQGAVNKYDLTEFVKTLPGLLRGSEVCGHFQGPRSLRVDSLDLRVMNLIMSCN